MKNEEEQRFRFRNLRSSIYISKFACGDYNEYIQRIGGLVVKLAVAISFG